MSATLYIDGLTLPLGVWPDVGGNRHPDCVHLDVYEESPLAALSWIVSMHRQGKVPGLEEAVELGRALNTEVVSLSVSDVYEQESADEWAELTGADIGEDRMFIASQFLRRGLELPRKVLAKLLRTMPKLRAIGAQDAAALVSAVEAGEVELDEGVTVQLAAEPPPPQNWQWDGYFNAEEIPELDALEANATLLRGLLSSGTPEAIEFVRVPLLERMAKIGLLDTNEEERKDDALYDADYDSVWRYYSAVRQAAEYYASDERAAEKLGPPPKHPAYGPISLDWFVNESYPPSGFTPGVFIASIEAAFLAQGTTAPAGVITLQVPAGTTHVRWRTEGGIRALVSGDCELEKPTPRVCQVYEGPKRATLGLGPPPSDSSDATLAELEGRAQRLASEAPEQTLGKRRFLLLDLHAAGVIDGGPELTSRLERLGHRELLTYHDTALALASYYASDERRAWLPQSIDPPLVGGAVSLALFRNVPQPPPEESLYSWLAIVERMLGWRERIGESGWFFVRVHDRAHIVKWYAEDGVTAALLEIT